MLSRSLPDFVCLAEMMPAVSLRVGGRNEGKALRTVPYKGVDVNWSSLILKGTVGPGISRRDLTGTVLWPSL